jgi:hypothetical protein
MYIVNLITNELLHDLSYLWSSYATEYMNFPALDCILPMDPIQSDPSRALLSGAPTYQRLRKLTFATATAVGLEGVLPMLCSLVWFSRVFLCPSPS